MSKLAFFYDSDSVYKVSLRALERRDFEIDEADEEKGIIKATTKKGLLKPAVTIELQIQQIAENQSSLDIKSKIVKNWITPEGYEAKAEHKFINTLYKCFENL